MADNLAALLDDFAVEARNVTVGPPQSGSAQADSHEAVTSTDDELPCVHLIRTGDLQVQHNEGPSLRIKYPTLLIYARPTAHRLVTDATIDLQVVSANLDFGNASRGSLAAALPPVVWLPLSELEASTAVLDLLFEESAAQNGAREQMLKRLIEIVLIQAMRQLTKSQNQQALLAGLTHPQLRRALVSIHEQLEKDWSREELAALARMPADEFVSTFRNVVGVEPGLYQQHFRTYLEWYMPASARPDFFADEIERFASTDCAHPPPPRPVVFVGGSSIRFWETLARDMAPLPVLNRGFGGGHLSQVVRYAGDLVTRYRPRAVVLYAGDNDLDSRTGRTTDDVVQDFRKFVALVQAAVPHTRIYYVSIKPSRMRWSDWPAQQEANRRIAALCATDPQLDFIDIATPMLARGAPPPRDLFWHDGLHLSARAYALWSAIIRPRLLEDLAGSSDDASLEPCLGV